MGVQLDKAECEAIIKEKRLKKSSNNPILSVFEKKEAVRYEKGGIDCGARYSKYFKLAPGEDDPTC